MMSGNASSEASLATMPSSRSAADISSQRGSPARSSSTLRKLRFEGGRRTSPPPRDGPNVAGLDGLNVGGVRSLRAVLGLERDLRALGQGVEARAADAGVMDEEVLPTVVGRDEPEALLIAEPLHGSSCHFRVLHGRCAAFAEELMSNLRAPALRRPDLMVRPLRQPMYRHGCWACSRHRIGCHQSAPLQPLSKRASECG